MKIQLRNASSAALLIAFSVLFLPGCHKKKEVITPDAKFREYIVAYTSGVISVESSIRIRLAEDYPKPVTLNTAIEDKLFSFNPSIKGSAFWRDSRTIEFVPDNPLKGGTVYTCTFHLSKILDVPKGMERFEFGFQTIQQIFSVALTGYKPYVNTDLRWNRISGDLLTADVIDGSEIEKVLYAEQNGKKLPLSWDHESNRTTHKFVVDSVKRGDKEGKVTVFWDGSPVHIENKDKEEFTIPALGDFKLMDAKVVQQPSQYIHLQFSDPLDKNQNLDGLIHLDNGVSVTFAISDNEVRIYPATRQSGSVKLYIEEGIRNIMGYKFPKTEVVSLAFEEVKPAVRLIGKGVILPSSAGMAMPFEAVNLKAVDVRIIRIYENNITQFLQVNNLDGTNQLKRVGRLILKKEIPLTSSTPIDYGTWNTFSLDLSSLIKQEPGAIYRVEISFRKQYSLYPCAGEKDENQTGNEEGSFDDTDEQEYSYWDAWESYGDYYDEYEDYYYYDDSQGDRNDPCSPRYYTPNRSVARNILVSDLGIIAKGGSDKNMVFAVTDLKTTNPLSGVKLEVYNYQKQLIASANTDGEGLARIRVESVPFLLIAKSGDQRGYLRLDEGSSLSLSSFDVSGNAVQKGIKGFIYGERGVWRPGDTLFLIFILEDKEKLIPENHPVIFELTNPRGQLTKKLVKTTGMNGFYQFTVPTSPDAPTGNWTATIRVGGTIFSKSLMIETVKPNRLKINLDFGVKTLSVSHPDVKGALRVTWLHGAVARSLKANIKATLTQSVTRFDKYPDFTFDDPVRTFNSEEHTVFEGTLNDQGEATIASGITVNDAAPGMLTASFITRVFEEGGDFSIDRFSIPYAPFNTFVGIRVPKGDKTRGMLLTDTTHTVQVVTLTPDGTPVSVKGLEVKIYKINWRWWWDRSGDNLADYTGDSYHQPILSTTVSTEQGKGHFNFRIKYPEWGRYLIRVIDPTGGHATGKIIYVDWPGWAGRSQEKNPAGASMLVFSADKEKYNVGEEAVITFPSGGIGRALVSVESGSRVINAWWVKAEKNQTVFRFKITEEMSPNVYVHLTLVQPHAQTANDLPIRLYGVIPLMVEDPQTHLQPRLTMPDVLQPESRFTVKISESKGREMTYTLAIVDEGLLDLTRYKTPEPWSSFYAREALGVKTWDLYDLVLGAYGGKIQQLLGLGGDEEARMGGAKSRANRFKPVVMFAGPYTLGKGKTAMHTFTMPRYVGSVRTMLVAGNGRAYGSAEKTTPVRKPLMVLATLPRVLSPGETVDLPVTVFAMEKNVRKVEVEIRPNGFLLPTGGSSRSVSFSETGDQTVTFPLKVASRIGVANVQVIAKSGSESARYDIELEVRNPNSPATEFTDGVAATGKTWKTIWKTIGMTGTNKGVLEVSSLPPIDFGRRLRYLLTYPYGCVEQTTSAVFPQLYLEDVMEMKEAEKQAARKNILAGIERLKLFIRPDGGFCYWPGASESDDWATSYAGHFLLEAEAKGYTIPSGFKQAWIRYQRNAARDWSSASGKYQYLAYRQSDLLQAYRLYTLALAGAPESGAMNRLRERKDLSTQAAWRLAAAYAQAGQPDVARTLIANLPSSVKEYNGCSPTYGSPERDEAMILETLVLIGEQEKAFPIVKKLSEVLGRDHWLSTQTTAYSLIAMSKFAGKKGYSHGLNFEYSLNGGKYINASSNLSVCQIAIDVNKSESGQVAVLNKGTGVIYARVVMTGIPEEGKEKAAESNLRMQVHYKTLDGKPIDVGSLQQGTDFMAEVTVSHPGVYGYYKDMALTQMFPSGWEIHSMRLDNLSQVYQSDSPTYQDIRDDRVNTFFDLPQGKSKTFIILLNASYTGKFWLPGVTCDAMYDGTIFNRTEGRWVEVVK